MSAQYLQIVTAAPLPKQEFKPTFTSQPWVADSKDLTESPIIYMTRDATGVVVLTFTGFQKLSQAGAIANPIVIPGIPREFRPIIPVFNHSVRILNDDVYGPGNCVIAGPFCTISPDAGGAFQATAGKYNGYGGFAVTYQGVRV